MTDARGVPLSVVASGANRHDVKQLPGVLDGIVALRPAPTPEKPQHLCADAAYVGEAARKDMTSRGYTPHVRSRREEKVEKTANSQYKARRWVVEACHSWFNRFRKLLVRYEKTDRSYYALLNLASAIIAFRKVPTTKNIIWG